MTAVDVLQRRFARANELWVDLVDALTDDQLRSRLAGLPSNTLAEQLWCVLGARESYPRAARAGEWAGFTSPLTAEETEDADAVRSALTATEADVLAWLDTLTTDEDWQYALALQEHESQHHGQVIRYLYALGIARPQSWQRQYALDEDA